MSIRQKLILSFIVVALLSAVVGYVGWNATRDVFQDFDAIVEETTPEIVALGQIDATSMRLLAEMFSVVLLIETEGGAKGQIEDELAEMEDASRGLDKAVYELAQIEEFEEEEGEKAFLGIIKNIKDELFDMSFLLVNAKKYGKNEEEIHVLKDEVERIEDSLEEAIGDRIAAEVEELGRRGAHANSSLNSSLRTIFIVSMIAILLAVFLGLVMSRLISKPIIILRDSALEIGKGKLDIIVETKSKDEIGDLVDSFNKMVFDLKNSMISVDKLTRAQNTLEVANEKLREHEKRLEKALDEAEISAKAKSNFLANMSHEIRTPMNAILGFSDLLRKTTLNDKQKTYLDAVASGGELLVGIIDDILDVSKLESGKIMLEEVDFNLETLIYDAFKMIVVRMKDKPFDTYVDIDSNVPINVKGDPTRLKQVFVNLLGNAVKFTSQGNIGVIVRLLHQKDVLPGEDVEICFRVKDTGIGIPNDKLDAIFESFTQADESTTRKFGGTGLGLTISKALVGAMGGKIDVESEEGVGTEFIFTVKLNAGEVFDNKEMDASYREVLEYKKVFVVDDSKIARKIIYKCCEEMGLKMFGEADSPQAALHKLDNLKTQKDVVPDLILCDLMMEGMNGHEFIKKVKENKAYKDTKCVAVTADITAESSKEATSEVFDAYIIKPVEMKEMMVTLAYVLGYQKEQEKTKENKMSCEGIKVLVVEDSLPNQMLIQAYFEELGCEGHYANNGEEAIAMLNSDNEFDMCLMDLQMPIMGGVEATEIIRKDISQSFPIIALTAAVMREDKEKAETIGMTDFLSKPIDINKLRKTILQYAKPSE